MVSVSFPVVLLFLIVGQSYARHNSKYYTYYESIIPQNRYELSPYDKYYYNLDHEKHLPIPSIASLIQPAIFKNQQQIQNVNYNEQNEHFQENNENGNNSLEDNDSVVIVAADSKGRKYLISQKVLRTLQDNGLTNNDGSVLFPNGALKIEGQRAIDVVNDAFTNVIPEETFQQIDNNDADELAIVTNDYDEFGRTFSIGGRLSLNRLHPHHHLKHHGCSYRCNRLGFHHPHHYHHFHRLWKPWL